MAAESDIELIIEHVNNIIDETSVESRAAKDVDIVVKSLWWKNRAPNYLLLL